MIEQFLRRSLWGAIVAGPLCVLGLLYFGTLPDPELAGPVLHFYIVTGTSVIVLVLAVVMRVAAGQLGDPRALFLSLAFLSIAAVFVVHALTTPGILVGMNPWVGFSAGFSPLLGSIFLLLSTRRWSPVVRARIVERQRGVTFVASSGLIALGAFAMLTSAAGSYPGGLPDVLISPITSNILIAVTTGMLVYVIGHYVWIYRSWKSPLATGILISAILLAQSQVSITFAPTWHLSWWLYHALLLAGFGAALVTLYIEYSRSGTVQGVVGGLLLRDSMAQLQRGYTDVIVALIEAVEAKDPYTRGHTQRVSELSQLIAQDLGLSNEKQRILNQSAILHDIGKIGIPDAVLNKPGRLTDSEFGLIKEHPVRGYRMIRHVHALRQESEGVRYHHERLDGS
ncbi:MAG: HD domain-containing phosphohydrolase, partial [Thermomicrobiaceae bacterium]